MSPSRARARRAPAKRARSRREVTTAALGAFAVVAFTVIAVWALRPGSATVPGTGGIAHRQPRATWLIVAAIVAAVLITWLVLGSRRWRPRAPIAIPVAMVVILAGAIVVAAAWPDGLLRHYVSLTPATVATTTTTAKGTTTTTAAGTTSTTTSATTTSSG